MAYYDCISNFKQFYALKRLHLVLDFVFEKFLYKREKEKYLYRQCLRGFSKETA